MTRKRFLQDLEQVKHNCPAHITGIERYDGDGVSFTYWYQRHGLREQVVLKLITTNLDEYPDGNQFMIYTEDLDVDHVITDAFAQIQAVIDGASVISALREISGGLQQIVGISHADDYIPSGSSSQAHSDWEIDALGLDEQDDDDDGDDLSFGLNDLLSHKVGSQAISRPTNGTIGDNLELIKRDLLSAKKMGFKIGVHGDLSKAGIVCVSIRVTKLGISEEAMQAWGLLRDQYLVLLIRFHRGYRSISQVMGELNLGGSVEMRVGLSDTYKPSVHEAFAAFNQIEVTATSAQTTSQDQHTRPTVTGNLKSLFIGRPINSLLRERFTKIVKFRHQFGLSWYGAERMFNNRQGYLFSDLSEDITSYRVTENVPRGLPDIVKQDTLSDMSITEASLPLVSMQFVLRHLVRCTEFCLVCHCRVEDTFEALKPYVCSNPLCLYQFMALGFGPAAEWEILSQPYVVDLLISLCYSQARATKLREFPLGINLKVPILPHFINALPTVYRHHYTMVTPVAPKKPLSAPTKAFKANFDPDSKTLSPILGSWTNVNQRVNVGDWLVIISSTAKTSRIIHCRVAEELGATFACDSLIHCMADMAIVEANRGKPKQYAGERPWEQVDCYLYDASFEELPDLYRHHAIVSLLDTLPPVGDMRKCLLQQQGGHRDANLNLLRKLCPPSALDLLRWIIASNRSCIMQVDEVATGNDPNQRLRPSEDRVSGMDDYLQFRFAQGAPDKEQRFVDCVKAKSSSTDHPTLFAWHGSPLYNWHSIVRQGLNFDEVIHGRASGNGIYMSPFVTTSIGYTGERGGGVVSGWPNSILKPSSVVSLQEVVNAPTSFVCNQPHFVVAEKDWIQTRYLFVKTKVRHSVGACAKNTYEQDPVHYARGTLNETVSIPITAISKPRRPVEDKSLSNGKKRKHVLQDTLLPLDGSDDGLSVATDEADRDLLRTTSGFANDADNDVIMNDIDDLLDNTRKRPLGSKLSNAAGGRGKRADYILDQSRTDFVPGTLDTSGIRFLDPPKSASISATKALMRAFNDTIQVQKTTPLHDLGFYIDPHRLENMYQWIVELHSFDKSLPLSQDMKAAGITSIVFEMQFTNDFPFSPPFVRVVKPRFLDPMMGGGGHITNGGAICMELLTASGWSAVNSIESVLLQVRLAMSERERPARLLSGRGGFQIAPYPIGEAIAAYRRFCQRHGWQAPKGLDSLQVA